MTRFAVVILIFPWVRRAYSILGTILGYKELSHLKFQFWRFTRASVCSRSETRVARQIINEVRFELNIDSPLMMSYFRISLFIRITIYYLLFLITRPKLDAACFSLKSKTSLLCFQLILVHYKQLDIEVPLSCWWAPRRDIFRLQEEHKEWVSEHQYDCSFCGKAFISEHHLDLHFDRKHSEHEYKASLCFHFSSKIVPNLW